MSRREKEQGLFTFPAGEFNRFLKEFRVKWDQYLADRFALALRIHERFGNLKYAEARCASFDQLRQLGASEQGMEDAWDLFMNWGLNQRLKKPLKADLNKRRFGPVRSQAKGKGEDALYFELCYEASLTINLKDRTVFWEVDESNHAVDKARENEVGKWFFRFLNGVKWTSKTGGETEYMNENMEDAGQWSPSINNQHGYARIAFDKALGIRRL